MQVRTIAFVFALVTAAVASPAGQLVQVAQEGSSLRYHIVHKLHTVDAVAKNVEGKALIQPDGSVQIMVRAPVSAFDSGDGNRDEHMKETVESLRFPYVTFKGLARLPAVNTYPGRLAVPVDGELEFHWQKNAERLNIDVMVTSAT
ncbi:MAG: YceI family protein, partial [Deltaproteobacteria bacterium]|nr:YceI family protein [Deltaproteobacteria bacterium]